jgi:hypothetical protein
VFQYWYDGSSSKTLFPACILYKDWLTTRNSTDLKVGFEGCFERNQPEVDDFYIQSIKDHVIQWIQQGAQDNQPDAILVLSDFFKAARTHFEDGFNWPKEKRGKAYEQNQKACKSKSVKYYSLNDCRFVFAVPDSLACKSEYTNLIRKAFVQAGFLKQDDDDNRLIFIDDAVATGYSCVYAPQNFSGIELDTNYLVADLGYDSTKFAIIQAQKTAATSSVLPSTHEKKVAGYRSFSDNFRKYITERSDTFDLDITQPENVALLVDAFENYKKVSLSYIHAKLS